MSASISALNSVVINGGSLPPIFKLVFFIALTFAILRVFPMLLRYAFPRLFLKKRVSKKEKKSRFDIGSFGRSRTTEMLYNIETPDLLGSRGGDKNDN